MYMFREKSTWRGDCSQQYPFKKTWLVTEPEAVGCACVADRHVPTKAKCTTYSSGTVVYTNYSSSMVVKWNLFMNNF